MGHGFTGDFVDDLCEEFIDEFPDALNKWHNPAIIRAAAMMLHAGNREGAATLLQIGREHHSYSQRPFLIDNNPHDMGILAAMAAEYLGDCVREHGVASMEELTEHVPWSLDELSRLRKLMIALVQDAEHHALMYGTPHDGAPAAALPGKSVVQSALDAQEDSHDDHD